MSLPDKTTTTIIDPHEHADPSKTVVRKKRRVVFTESQLSLLKQVYSVDRCPDQQVKNMLEERTGLSQQMIKVWFQNERNKMRRKDVLEQHEQGGEQEPVSTGTDKLRQNGCLIKSDDSDDGFEHISELDLATENASYKQEMNTPIDRQKTIDDDQIGHEVEKQNHEKREVKVKKSNNLTIEQMKDEIEMNESVYECKTSSNEAMKVEEAIHRQLKEINLKMDELLRAQQHKAEKESIENNRVEKCDEGIIEAVKQEITSHDASERKISELKWNNNELWKKNRKFEALVRTLEKQNKMKEEMDEVDLMLDNCAERRKVNVPDGLYAIYNVNPKSKIVQSITTFNSYRSLRVSDEKGIITKFVQIFKHSKDANQTVAIRCPVREKYLTMNRLKSGTYGNSSILQSNFNGTNVDDINSAFELFAPGNCKQDPEQFEVIIRSVQFGRVVLFDGFWAVFILKPSTRILRTLKTHVPETICFIRMAESNDDLAVRNDNNFTFRKAPGDMFCPVWNDDEGSFCLFLHGRNSYIGLERHSAQQFYGPSDVSLFLSADETKKAKFWVHQLDTDGYVNLWYGTKHENLSMSVCELRDNCLGSYSKRLMLQFHQ